VLETIGRDQPVVLGGARLVPIAAGDLALLRGALAGVAATT